MDAFGDPLGLYSAELQRLRQHERTEHGCEQATEAAAMPLPRKTRERPLRLRRLLRRR